MINMNLKINTCQVPSIDTKNTDSLIKIQKE